MALFTVSVTLSERVLKVDDLPQAFTNGTAARNSFNVRSAELDDDKGNAMRYMMLKENSGCCGLACAMLHSIQKFQTTCCSMHVRGPSHATKQMVYSRHEWANNTGIPNGSVSDEFERCRSPEQTNRKRDSDQHEQQQEFHGYELFAVKGQGQLEVLMGFVSCVG